MVPPVKHGEIAFLVVAGLITAVGATATLRSPRQKRPRMVRRRWSRLGDSMQEALGPVGAFYAVALVSVVPLILLCWPLGALTRHKPLSTINERVLHAYDSGRAHWLTSAMKLLTQMGNWYQIATVAVVAAVIFALVSRSRRWVPPLIILTTLLGERYLQKVITNITKVHHPPTDLGTYPSGGVARLVAIYGIVGFIALRILLGRSQRARTGGLWLLALLTWIEIFSRIYLQKHWLFDTVGGLLLGGGILVVAIVASSLLPWPAAHDAAEPGSLPAETDSGSRLVEAAAAPEGSRV